MRLQAKTALIALATLAATSARPTQAVEPQRIISLAPSVTETVFALGFGNRLVGVSVYCDYPPDAKKIDRVGTFLTPNIELIVAKRPDLVLAAPSPGNREGVESLRRLGLKVVVVDPNTLEEIKQSLVTIGHQLGHEAEGRALAADIERRMAAVSARIADAPRRRVLMVVGHTPLIAVGKGTLQDELISMARGINLGRQAGSAWPHLTLEFVIRAAPEVIIDTAMGSEERIGANAGAAYWNSLPTLPAVRGGRVYGHKADELLRPGPRVAEAFEAIARFIHPERFE